MTAGGSVLAAGAALARREALLIVRRPSRVAATILTPALVWAFFAGGFADSVAGASDGGGRAYVIGLAGGTALLVVLFSSIFGSLSLIRDRESGFLRAILVGPTPRPIVMLSKTTTSGLLAAAQATPVLLASIAVGARPGAGGVLLGVLVLAASALGLAGVCLALAWRFDSVEGFHGVMNAVLMPAWLLSGAVFPPGADLPLFKPVLLVNPLAHAHACLLASLGVVETAPAASAIVTAGFALAGLILAAIVPALSKRT